MTTVLDDSADITHVCVPARLDRCDHSACEDLRKEHPFVRCGELPCSELIAAQAREFAGHVIVSWGCWQLLDLVIRVVSELATNAWLHGLATGTTTVRMYIDGRRVWFEIDDPTDVEPKMPPPDEDLLEKAGGWGLLLVKCFTDEFGWRIHQGGKTVFAGWLLP